MLTHRAIARVAVAAGASVLLAACGSKSPTSGSLVTQPSVSTSSVPTSVPVFEQVVVSSAHSTAKYASQIKASPGDNVAMRTTFGRAQHGSATVTLSLTRKSSTTVNVTASARGRSSQATIATANGKPIKLAYVRYLCYLPSTPTFCHAVHTNITGSDYVLHFHAPLNMPLDLTATVEPSSGPTASAAPHGTQLVPPFKASQQVRTEFGSGTAGRYGSSVSVKAGAIIDLLTQFNGAPASAKPQKATLVIDRGPSPTLRVSATVDGGPPSIATITSADGRPMRLLFPRYVCYAPPAATFCPALHKTTTTHKYKVQFAAIPGVPIALFASSQ